MQSKCSARLPAAVVALAVAAGVQAQTRCCLPDGTCVDLPAAQCGAEGGLFFPDGCTSCEARGACCLTDRCVFVTPSWCADRGGAYQGDGTVCDEISCPAFGACCFESVLGELVCSVVSPEVCDRIPGGTFQGLGTSCLTGGCALTPTGACCRQTGADPFCERRTPLDCASVGGIYQGDGVGCADVQCAAQPLGACCLPGAALQCFPATQRQCEGGQFPGGVWGGADTVCLDGILCPGEIGACCAFGGCIRFSRIQCEAGGGVFLGDGVECPAGACEPCDCDVNDDLVTDVFDILLFLDGFFSGNGDFNGDGATNVVDLLAFLICLFRGCP